LKIFSKRIFGSEDQLSKNKDQDRELQIELTRLQVKHEHNITLTTVFLSVLISMMLTILSVYVPLGVITNNLLYPLVATIFNLVLLIPIYSRSKRATTLEAKLDKDIQDLKDRFLSKQTPPEVKENQTPVSKTQGGNWKVRLKKTENLALILSLIALIFTGLIVIHEYYPPAPRAKLTIFLDNPSIGHISGNVTEVDLEGRIVNEGSLAGKILRWDLFIAMNVSYKILLDRSEISPTDLLLSPAEEGNFTMQRTLIGENDTTLPDTAIRSCIAWFEYKDDYGLRVAQGEIDFL